MTAGDDIRMRGLGIEPCEITARPPAPFNFEDDYRRRLYCVAVDDIVDRMLYERDRADHWKRVAWWLFGFVMLAGAWQFWSIAATLYRMVAR
jgi:hypothetical protein